MGDRKWDIINEWMRLYGDRIIRMVYLVIDDYAAAEEITQEVFVKAYSCLDNFRGESSVYTWLYRIALNLSKNHLSRSAKIKFMPFASEQEQHDLNDLDTESLEEQIVRTSVGKKVRDCIVQLPLNYREVIILYYYDDLKISDISRVLEQPEGTIKSKLSRGRELLEKIMRKEGLEYER